MFQIKEDIRIHNTKQFVYEAFAKLIKKFDYNQITISMIIKKSGIGRTTFYRHFYTKDDIIINKLKSETLEMVKLLYNSFDLTIYNKDISDKIKLFFHFWDRNPEIIDVIIMLDKTQILYTVWPSLLIQMFSVLNIAIESNASKQYTSYFALGGLTSLLIQWFKNDRRESAAYISKHFYIPN